MRENTINVEFISVAEIYDYACRVNDAHQPGDVVPITKMRALAWQHNPHAQPDDTALIVAYVDGQCAGYRGFMPGILRTPQGDERIYWGSTYYVDPRFRHLGIGANLVFQVRNLSLPLVGTSLSDDAKRMGQSVPTKRFPSLRYFQVTLKPPRPLVMAHRTTRRIAKKIAFRLVSRVDQCFEHLYRLSRLAKYASLHRKTEKHLKSISTKRVNSLRDRTFEAEEDSRAPLRFFRGADVINWMLKYRWVATGDEPATPEYYFTHWCSLFEYVAMEIYDTSGENYRGFVVMRTDGKWAQTQVVVLDFHFCDPADQRFLVPLALAHAKAQGANVILYPAECGDDLQMYDLTRKNLSVCSRDYFCRAAGNKSALTSSLDDLELRLADGDTFFA